MATEHSITKRCLVPDCNRTARTRGWCNMHYLRWKKHGARSWIACRVGGVVAQLCSRGHPRTEGRPMSGAVFPQDPSRYIIGTDPATDPDKQIYVVMWTGSASEWVREQAAPRIRGAFHCLATIGLIVAGGELFCAALGLAAELPHPDSIPYGGMKLLAASTPKSLRRLNRARVGVLP